MIFCSGLGVPEGPVLLPGGDWLVVEMSAERGCVTRLTADGTIAGVIARTGRPNGLAIDRRGAVWVAESLEPALLRLTMDKTVSTVMRECDGEPFLFPNDLAFGPDGALYLTDSGILVTEFAPGGAVRPDYDSVDINGKVFRIDLTRSTIETLDDGFRFTNGIAFDARGDLYVNETVTGNIYRYARIGNGTYGPRRVHGNVLSPDGPPRFRGPDGMKFSTDGRLFVAVYGQGDVTVLEEDGRVADRIPTHGAMPTNLTFGPEGSRTIYVTEVEHGTMEAHEVGTDGLPLHLGPEETT